MGKDATRVFISYSRVDQALITPIVQVMRATGATVFQDVDSITYGKRWRLIIENSIDLASIVILFWCTHSRNSDEVRKEWERAVQAGKDMVPTLLDDTPLDAVLAEYQSIDLRALAASHFAGRRGLLPGERERWEHRHLDPAQGNHLQHVDSRIVRESAIHLLSIIKARAEHANHPE